MITLFKSLRLWAKIGSVALILIGAFFLMRAFFGIVKAGFYANFVAPKVALAVAPLQSKIAEYKADSAVTSETIVLLNKDNANYADSLAEMAAERTQAVQALQRTIQQVESRRKTLQKENAQLAKGVRVDLVTLTYRDRLFGKDKAVDSTYFVGWKWGLD